MVSTPQELLERCVRLLQRCVKEDSALVREMAPARVEFFRGDLSQPGAAAERRFQEWFLFERPSKARGEAPVFSFQDRLVEELPEKARDFAGQLAESVFGVFEIEEELDDRWSFQDLLTQREYSVQGPLEGRDEAECKNFVGRLFPCGNEEHFVSPASRRFVPEKEIWDALREDLHAARQAHSGNRVSQAALEPILWPPETTAPVGEIDLETIESRWDALVPPSDPLLSFSKVRELLANAKNTGAVAAEILDHLAFETKAQIDEARLLLLQLRDSLPRLQTSKPCPCGSQKTYEECCRSNDALKAFDEGKARGENLDALFRKLELDLGLDPDEEEDPGEVPTEPELTPLVDEFLWETHTAQAPELRAMFLYLEQQSETPVAHIEEITEESIARYLTLIFPMSPDGKDPQKAHALLKDLVRFALWADIEQGTKMASFVERLAKPLESDLPRVARCNQALQNGSASTAVQALKVWEVVKIAGEGRKVVELQSLQDAQEKRLAAAEPEVLPQLRTGDLAFVRLPGDAKEAGRLQVVLPALAKPFLE